MFTRGGGAAGAGNSALPAKSAAALYFASSMLIHELTHAQCVEILQRATLARLACAYQDQPYILPVHLSYDADRHCLYGFSAVGQKIYWMRDNPKVCVEVEEIEHKDHWTTVLVFGRYEEIGDDPEDSSARQRIWALFQQREEWWLPAAAKVQTTERPTLVVYRVEIDRMTGRRALRQKV